MKYSFKPGSKVCCVKIDVETDPTNTIVENVQFTGGCPGNLEAISRLAAGRPITELISSLENINCGGKGTSCAHELTQGLRKIKK